MLALLLSLTLATTEPTLEQTLSIIKPDAFENLEAIEPYFESAGLHIVQTKEITLTKEQAEEFYAVHKDRPFYNDLTTYMSSGPILVQVLEGPDAVALNRKIMGATNPANAEPGTIRADFGTSIQQNAVHGSDSLANAQKEIAFFFPSEAAE